MEADPSPGRTRQRRINRQLGGAMAASFFLGVTLSVAALIASERDGLVGWLVAAGVGAVALLIAVVGYRAMMRYWRGIDELARDAHKTAWFWGASAGLLLSWAPLCVAYALQSVRSDPDPHLTGAYLGALAVVGAQLLGYGVFWVAFWLRNR